MKRRIKWSNWIAALSTVVVAVASVIALHLGQTPPEQMDKQIESSTSQRLTKTQTTVPHDSIIRVYPSPPVPQLAPAGRGGPSA